VLICVVDDRVEGAFVDVASLGLHAVEAGVTGVVRVADGAVHVVEAGVDAVADGAGRVADGAGRLVDGKYAFAFVPAVSLCGSSSVFFGSTDLRLLYRYVQGHLRR
jgi:X-X-X-Leu-X-X-Gly heptad repeat protein